MEILIGFVPTGGVRSSEGGLRGASGALFTPTTLVDKRSEGITLRIPSSKCFKEEG